MKCKFIKENGSNCQGNSINGSQYCFTHDPNKTEERNLAVRKGGLAPKRLLLQNEDEIELVSAADAKIFLGKVINCVWRGEIPATPIANTLGFLIRCFLDAHQASDFQDKLDDLEKRLERANL